jgi:hypothetical protein
MEITTIGIDLAKSVFAVCGADSRGASSNAHGEPRRRGTLRSASEAALRGAAVDEDRSNSRVIQSESKIFLLWAFRPPTSRLLPALRGVALPAGDAGSTPSGIAASRISNTAIING